MLFLLKSVKFVAVPCLCVSVEICVLYECTVQSVPLSVSSVVMGVYIIFTKDFSFLCTDKYA